MKYYVDIDDTHFAVFDFPTSDEYCPTCGMPCPRRLAGGLKIYQGQRDDLDNAVLCAEQPMKRPPVFAEIASTVRQFAASIQK